MSDARLSDSTRAAPRRLPPRRSLRLSWSDERVRGIVWQVLIVAVVVGVIWWLWQNTTTNLRTRNIATGLDFLWREAGLPIGESLIGYTPADSYFRALLTGLLNTLKVAAVGIVLATVLGTLIAPFVLATLGILAGAVIAACRTWPIRLHLSGHLRVAFAPWCAAGWAVAVLVSAMAAGYG